MNEILAKKNKNDTGEGDDPLPAQNPAGDCVLGTGSVYIASSIYNIRVELSKMKAEKITMTLDCCRIVSRGEEEELFVVHLE